VKPLIDIPKMAALTQSMLLRSLEAFVKVDAELAQTILPADDEVDALRDKVYTELVELMQREPALVPGAVDLIFVARNLERIADHATNIAEDVIFLAKGVDVRRAVVRPAMG
jgi:phosphate transport system protein